MATQIKKLVQGPLTASPAEAPAVIFKLPPTVNGDGETVDGKTFLLSLENLSEDIITRLALHGLSQKVGDSFAGAGEEPNPLKYAEERIIETYEQLRKGEWRVTVAGGPRASLLARALARVTGHSLEEAIEVVEGLDDEQKKAIRKDPAIKKASADIKLEDAQKAKERAEGAAGEGSDLAGLFT